MILMDTHVLLWSRTGAGQTGPRSRRRIEQALHESDLGGVGIYVLGNRDAAGKGDA